MIPIVFLTSLAWADTCDFALARIQYKGGGDWYSDPSSLPNLIEAIRTQTRIDICPKEKRIALSDPELFNHPLLYITGHGNIRFSELEVLRLREFLLAGGFLIADDNYGMDASFRREMARVFPELSWVEIPFSHPIYHSFHNFPNGLPKIHKHAGGPPKGLALISEGRMLAFYSFNTDLGDGWEDPEVHNHSPKKHGAALRMGVNIVTYALSQ